MTAFRLDSASSHHFGTLSFSQGASFFVRPDTPAARSDRIAADSNFRMNVGGPTAQSLLITHAIAAVSAPPPGFT